MQDDDPRTATDAQSYDIRLFAQLLRPSSLSGLLCLLVAFFTVAGVAVIANYQGSGLQQDLLGLRQRTAEEKANQDMYQIYDMSLSDDYGQINDTFADSNLVRNIPVMAFWMFVGMLVYFLVTGISGALGNAKGIEDELHYVHIKRKVLLREVYQKTAIRFCTFLFWLLYIQLFFRIIVPYVLAAAHIGGGNIVSLRAIPYMILSFVIMTVALHVHVILLRLVMLRPRVFSQETSF